MIEWSEDKELDPKDIPIEFYSQTMKIG